MWGGKKKKQQQQQQRREYLEVRRNHNKYLHHGERGFERIQRLQTETTVLQSIQLIIHYWLSNENNVFYRPTVWEPGKTPTTNRTSILWIYCKTWKKSVPQNCSFSETSISSITLFDGAAAVRRTEVVPAGVTKSSHLLVPFGAVKCTIQKGGGGNFQLL